MKTYVVCVSDSAGADRRTPVIVEEDTGMGRVSQMAIDDFLAFFGDEVQLPLFVDIHAGDQFANVSWLHPRPST